MNSHWCKTQLAPSSSLHGQGMHLHWTRLLRAVLYRAAWLIYASVQTARARSMSHIPIHWHCTATYTGFKLYSWKNIAEPCDLQPAVRTCQLWVTLMPKQHFPLQSSSLMQSFAGDKGLPNIPRKPEKRCLQEIGGQQETCVSPLYQTVWLLNALTSGNTHNMSMIRDCPSNVFWTDSHFLASKSMETAFSKKNVPQGLFMVMQPWYHLEKQLACHADYFDKKLDEHNAWVYLVAAAPHLKFTPLNTHAYAYTILIMYNLPGTLDCCIVKYVKCSYA